MPKDIVIMCLGGEDQEKKRSGGTPPDLWLGLKP
jgi:hypothetical protein